MCFCNKHPVCILQDSYVCKCQCKLCAGSRCSKSSLQDVIFVIDASRSIGRVQFPLIRDFTANLTSELFRSSPQSAAGVIFIQSYAEIWFDLQAYTNLSALLSAINQLPYRGGTPAVGEALTLLLTTAQNEALGLRSDSSKLAIVISGGRSSNQSTTLSAAAALHASNIFDVYAVGVGGADQAELEAIASGHEFVFFTSFLNSVDLKQLKVKILQEMCNGK